MRINVLFYVAIGVYTVYGYDLSYLEPPEILHACMLTTLSGSDLIRRSGCLGLTITCHELVWGEFVLCGAFRLYSDKKNN